jgi:uncharacterized membrane protein
MARFNFILLAVSCAVGVLAISTADIAMFQIARVALGVLIVFVVPGFSLVSAALPKQQFSPGEFVLSTLGASLAVSATAAVALGAAPVGLTKLSFSVALGCFTVLFSTTAIVRARIHRVPPETSGDTPN